MNNILMNIMNSRSVNTTLLLLAALTTVFVGSGMSEILAQQNNQTQQNQQDGIGSIEELEKLTSPQNTTDNSTGLLGGLEKSQLGESVPGEQGVKFEGQQDNQTQQQDNQTQQQGNQTTQSQAQQDNQTQQQGNQSTGPLQELGEKITGLFK
jgi:hypothetical protein